MSFPAVIAQSGGIGGTNSTTHTLTRPSGRQAGDMILWLVGFDTSTSISNWNELGTEILNIYDAADTNRDIDFFLNYEILSGSEGDTFDITTGSAKYSVFAALLIRGAHPSSAPEHVPASDGEYDLTGTSPDPSSLTPSWGSADTLWVACAPHADETVTTTGVPTNYTGITERFGNDHAMMAAYRQLAAASEDPGTFTYDASCEYVVATVAIRPNPDPLVGSAVNVAGVAYDGVLVPEVFLAGAAVLQDGVPYTAALKGADFLRPVIDTASGGWLGSVKDIDEEPASDTDFVYSPAAPNRVVLINESFESGLGGWTLQNCTRELVGDAYDGNYVIRCNQAAGVTGELFYDTEWFVIDPLARYRYQIVARRVSGTTGLMYGSVPTRNVGGDILFPNYSAIIQNTLTYLTAAAGSTDTSITVADATNWVDGNSAACVIFDAWPDFSDVESGRAYNLTPPLQTSRNITVGGISGNVISLDSAVGGTGYPAGTWVRCHRHTGTYVYPIASVTPPGTWTVYEGYFGPGFQSLRDRYFGSPNLSSGDADTWRPGSYDFRPQVLLNYLTTDTTVMEVDSIQLERLDNVKIVKLETTWETGIDGRDHVRYRYRKDVAVGTVNLKVTLLQKVTADPYTKNKYTEIESWQHNNIGTGWTSQKQTITNDAGITDRMELYLQFEATSS